MSKLPILYKTSIRLILIVATAIIGSLYTSDRVLLSDLQVKSGTVANAECYESRSLSGIKLLVNYSGSAEQDFILLPISIKCQDVIGKFIGNEVSISYHENAYFGVSVAGENIIQSEQALSEFNNKTSSIMFVSFMALVFVFVLYFRGKHVTSKGIGRSKAAPML